MATPMPSATPTEMPSPIFTPTPTGTPARTVSGVDPDSGPTTGGTRVTVEGAGFDAGATVTFGGAAGADLQVLSDTRIEVVTPASLPGPVDVVVTNSDGQSGTLAGGFTYIYTGLAPSVSSVKPSSGPAGGGRRVTIHGANFAAGATVTFGSATAADIVVVSGTQIIAITPPHAPGAADVTVRNPDGGTGTLVNGFTYLARGGNNPKQALSQRLPLRAWIALPGRREMCRR
jgi:large repetitive protein